MAFADMYEVRHFHVYDGRDLLNVYHVERADGTITAAIIAEAFEDAILPSLKAFQNDGVVNESVQVQSLSDVTDFNTRTLGSAAGTRSGAFLPGYVAATVRFQRVRADMKHGMKRYIGLLEADTNGSQIVSGALTLMGNIASAVTATWKRTAFPGVDVAHYTIIKRVCDEVDAEGKCQKYRLPESDGELVSYRPTSWLLEGRTRSQVSRKRLV